MNDPFKGPHSPDWTEEDQAASEPDFYGKWIDAKPPPKTRNNVLIECRSQYDKEHTYQCVGYHVARWKEPCQLECEAGEYSEEKDEYFLIEGWYECQFNWDEHSGIFINDDVVRYMPLPDKLGVKPA